MFSQNIPWYQISHRCCLGPPCALAPQLNNSTPSSLLYKTFLQHTNVTTLGLWSSTLQFIMAAGKTTTSWEQCIHMTILQQNQMCRIYIYHIYVYICMPKNINKSRRGWGDNSLQCLWNHGEEAVLILLPKREETCLVVQSIDKQHRHEYQTSNT